MSMTWSEEQTPRESKRPGNWYNPVVLWLLGSPLHFLISNNTLALTYVGHKSGTTYTLPVNFVTDGDDLLVVSSTDRTWWRNFRSPAPVEVRLRGQTVTAEAQALTEGAAFLDGLRVVLEQSRPMRNYLGIEVDLNGRVTDLAAVERAAAGRVVVRLRHEEER